MYLKSLHMFLLEYYILYMKLLSYKIMWSSYLKEKIYTFIKRPKPSKNIHLQRMVQERENIEYAAVLLVKMTCWCRRSEEYKQTGLSWLKGNSDSNMHKSNLEADGLQWQKTTPGFTPVSWEQETDATVYTGSLKLDNRRLEKAWKRH